MDFSKLKYNDFLKIVSNNNILFTFFKHFSIMKHNTERLSCPNCENTELKLVSLKNSPIGHSYRCPKRNCRKFVSCFKNTIFENKCVVVGLTILAGFVSKKKISEVMEDSGFDEKTVYFYYSLFRKKCILEFNESNSILGGEDMIVEIDESHLFKRKYNRGNILAFEHVWIFGILERETKKVVLKRVLNRNSETLYEIVRRHVRPGTVICADGWRGYSLIKKDYTMYFVNHSVCFVDYINRFVHTNTIERLWRSLKNELRGVSVENLDDHLKMFMFRREFLTGQFKQDLVFLLKLIFN